MMERIGVIMAGGEGSRLWPLSRRITPKQLLNLSGNGALINEAIGRLTPSVAETWVVTNQSQAELLKEIVDGVSYEHILIEPQVKNTAACIAYAAVKLIQEYGDAVMVVSPSDSYIGDWKKYGSVIDAAAEFATKHNALVTIGIQPTYPATGYGYIRFLPSAEQIKRADRFTEKPDKMTAERYINSGEYVWNSGVFVWKASVILKQFEKFLPCTYTRFMEFATTVGTEKEQEALENCYAAIKSVSIDYGILEKADNLFVLPADFGWTDVGSLDALKIFQEADQDGNRFSGDVISIGTKNSFVSAGHKLVALAGVENLIVIDTPDVTLVCTEDHAQEVKQIVEALKQRGRGDVL